MTDFDLMTYLNLHGSDTRTVFGAWNTGLGRGDFLYLDYVLHEFEDVKNIVELGSMHGLTTIYLGVVAALRTGMVLSYDIQDLIPFHIRNASDRLPVYFKRGDVLSGGTTKNEIILELSGLPNLMLFCDNGNKEKEIALYAPYLKQGDVLLVHDWGTEVHAENIVQYLVGYTPVAHDVAEAMQSHLRAWVKQ